MSWIHRFVNGRVVSLAQSWGLWSSFLLWRQGHSLKFQETNTILAFLTFSTNNRLSLFEIISFFNTWSISNSQNLFTSTIKKLNTKYTYLSINPHVNSLNSTCCKFMFICEVDIQCLFDRIPKHSFHQFSFISLSQHLRLWTIIQSKSNTFNMRLCWVHIPFDAFQFPLHCNTWLLLVIFHQWPVLVYDLIIFILARIGLWENRIGICKLSKTHLKHMLFCSFLN